MRVKNALLAIGTIAALALSSVASPAAEVSEKRLNEIQAMSPEQMAMTGAWTRANHDLMMSYINSIKDKSIRALVLDMVTNPRSTVFDTKAEKNAFRFAPAAGGPGHHFYPGGLAVHSVENVGIAFGWTDMLARVHGVDTLNRDIVIASLVLHDWAKVWYEWDTEKAEVKRPAWFPAYWGGDQGIAKWKWMGGHGVIVYSELLKRGAPIDLVVATASSHYDPFWDIDKANGTEGLNAALADAAKLAKVAIPKVDPAKRMAEWWLSVFSDGSWSYSHYIAGQFAHNWIREVAKDLGVDPKSPQANKLAWFVLTRISDFKLYSIYQSSGFSADAVKKLILSVLKDSSAYEVPAS